MEPLTWGQIILAILNQLMPVWIGMIVVFALSIRFKRRLGLYGKLYDSPIGMIGFALVMIFGRRWYKRLLDGDIFLFYLIWYPLGRFLVEMFRPDAWISGFGGLATAQVISLALLVVAVVILVVRHVRNRGAVADEPMDEPAADQTEAPSTDEPQAAEEAPVEVTADAVEQLTGDDQQE